LALTFTEPLLTFDLKDHRDPNTTTRLKLMIKIDKLSVQDSGKRLSNGGFAGTHHADQKNWTVMLQRTCTLGQVLGVGRGVRVTSGVRFGRKRFNIHAHIIPLTAPSLKWIRANPLKTFKMSGNEQI
jgi:hypothetical protein